MVYRGPGEAFEGFPGNDLSLSGELAHTAYLIKEVSITDRKGT